MRSVSVIVPCYNYGRFLEDCVSSALGQPDVDVEVLVIDDASSDDTAEVAGRLAATDPRVSYRRHETNAGHIATYNEGLDWARGDYVVLISADDILANGALGRAVSIMESDPGIGFVHGPDRFFTDRLPEQPPPDTPFTWTRHRGVDWFTAACVKGENPLVSPEVVVRAALQRRAGGYRHDLPHSADLEMWLRLALESDVGTVAGVVQAFSRRHAKSMRHTTFADASLSLEQRRAAYRVALERADALGVDVSRLRRLVGRSTARDAMWTMVQQTLNRSLTAGSVRTLSALAMSGIREYSTRAPAWQWVDLLPALADGAVRWSKGWVKARQRYGWGSRRPA